MFKVVYKAIKTFFKNFILQVEKVEKKIDVSKNSVEGGGDSSFSISSNPTLDGSISIYLSI